MIYVFEQGNVIYLDELMTEEMKSRAVAVEQLPIPEDKAGYIPEIRADLETKTVFYVYIPTEKTLEVQEEVNKAVDAYTAELIKEGIL